MKKKKIEVMVLKCENKTLCIMRLDFISRHVSWSRVNVALLGLDVSELVTKLYRIQNQCNLNSLCSCPRHVKILSIMETLPQPRYPLNRPPSMITFCGDFSFSFSPLSNSSRSYVHERVTSLYFLIGFVSSTAL